MPLDSQKAKERKQRYLRKKKIERYGADFANVDMRGRHGNQARGSKNGRWNKGRILSSEGYVLIRVGVDHPLAFGSGYAYEHQIVWVAAGNPLPKKNELIHHKDEDKTNNRIENLELITRSEHAKHHSDYRGRDSLGRFHGQKASPQNLA